MLVRVSGYAYFKDVARGRLSGGDASGFLKLVARAEGPTHHVIVGVQVIGACYSPVFAFSLVVSTALCLLFSRAFQKLAHTNAS